MRLASGPRPPRRRRRPPDVTGHPSRPCDRRRRARHPG